MDIVQLVKKGLEERIKETIAIISLAILSTLFYMYRSFFWCDIPSLISQNHEKLILGRAILILFCASILFLAIVLIYILSNSSKKRPLKYRLKQLYKLRNEFNSIKNTKGRFIQWGNKFEPLLKKHPEYWDDYKHPFYRLINENAPVPGEAIKHIGNALEKLINTLRIEIHEKP